MVLFGTEDEIVSAVDRCVAEGLGQHPIVNVGNGVIVGTPEEAVGVLIDRVKEHSKVVSSV